QTCDVSWDPARKELFDVYGEEERLAGDWGAWTGQGMNWNSMCASCHNTRLRKHYDPGSNSYHTTMVEMSIGCESCHGPMKAHVDWQNQPPAGYDPKAKNPPDPTIVRQSKDQMLDTCAACHARRAEITGDMVPGESFFDHYSLTVTDETDIYHVDGQVRDENYNHASFLSSRMYHKGVRCGDCHEPHSATRLIPGNMLCMRCHSANTDPEVPIIDPLAHSHHKDGSTGNDCVNCHMPQTTYMQRDPRHDHGFTIPDPLLTKEHGTPNACNRCHQDKSTDWALEWTQKWYGEKMERPTRKRAMLIASARRGEPAARAGLIEMLEKEPIAAWKASACHLLETWAMDPEVANALIGQLKHDSPLVREAALRTLVHQSRVPNKVVRDAIGPLLQDPIRSVRVAAAWALIEDLDLQSQAGRELVHMLDHNSDQPLGRMQLSQFAYLRGDPKAAIRQIRKAIEWDPNSPPFHHDLAILLSMQGDTQGAINALKDAVRLDPQNPDFHFKLGLAWSEVGNFTECAAALGRSLQLEPRNGRAWYNLGLAQNSLNQPAQAIESLRRAEALQPDDPDIPYAQGTILARMGQRQQAAEAAVRALQIRQNHQGALELLRSLGAR
ncbi:MAG TPA: tetratricopeptide repeat protein, partial [Luteolibacter sp.]|nr:tetratricopeptide repeat protein [Luteolibacter sp.]